MEKTVKINRAKAYYGLIIDEKSLIEVLERDVKFAKSLLGDNDYEVWNYLDDAFEDDSIEWSRAEVVAGSPMFVIVKNIMEMRDDQTFGDFKTEVHDIIKKIVPTNFTCSMINIPEEEYF